MHIARVCEMLPSLQIQFRISRSFGLRNPANLGSKIRFWICRKEHTPRGTNEMTSEWNYKNQNSSYWGKFQGSFDEGKSINQSLFALSQTSYRIM